MSYYVTIERMYCQCHKDIGQELARQDCWMMHFLQTKVGQVGVEDVWYDWNPKAFLDDLVRLRGLGVRGTIETLSSKGEWTRYKLTDQGIEQYFGVTVYPDEPNTRYDTEGGLVDD